MNRSEAKMGAIETEERRFRELFGVGAMVAMATFSWLNYVDRLPQGGTLKHFLWTLCFLKVYATETVMSSLCGGADPKTIRKWVWRFIFALSELEEHVVRLIVNQFLFCFYPAYCF